MINDSNDTYYANIWDTVTVISYMYTTYDVFCTPSISLQMKFNLFFVLCSLDNGSTTSELETIQERYTSCLKTYVEHTFPMQPNRLQDLLHRLPEVMKTSFVHFMYNFYTVEIRVSQTIHLMTRYGIL